jgi:hypothetical protein
MTWTNVSPEAASKEERHRSRWVWTVSGAVAVLGVVVLALAVGSGTLFPTSHTACKLGDALGNVSAWKPTTIAAAPYLGSVQGELIQTAPEPYGHSVYLAGIDEQDGNVTAYLAAPYNWTIVAASNTTVGGAGPSEPCPGPMEALLTSQPSVPGGTSRQQLAEERVSDAMLPGNFNATFMCAVVDRLPPGCATTASWNVNYSQAQGTISTCGSSVSQTVDTFGNALPASVPFTLSGQSRYVPVALSQEYLVSGSLASVEPLSTSVWLNYTFPADTGTWNYAYMLGSPPDSGGLVFSYTVC